MITAIDINQVEDFISKYEKDKENPTIFKLGIIDKRIAAEIDDKGTIFNTDAITGKIETKCTIGITKLLYVKYGLKGIENFSNKKGESIEFKTESISKGGKEYKVVIDEVITSIPYDVFQEIADRIKTINEISDDEVKN